LDAHVGRWHHPGFSVLSPASKLHSRCASSPSPARLWLVMQCICRRRRVVHASCAEYVDVCVCVCVCVSCLAGWRRQRLQCYYSVRIYAGVFGTRTTHTYIHTCWPCKARYGATQHLSELIHGSRKPPMAAIRSAPWPYMPSASRLHSIDNVQSGVAVRSGIEQGKHPPSLAMAMGRFKCIFSPPGDTNDV
jgi:hypothetical protein